MFVCKDCAARKDLINVKQIMFWKVGTILKCKECGDECNPQEMLEVELDKTK